MDARGHRPGSQNGAAADAETASAYRLVVLAYILAVSIPPIGLGLGIAVALRSSKTISKHGGWIIALSILAALAWVVIIGSGALNTASTDY